MTTENQQALLDLGRKKISDLTTKLNSEVKKVQLKFTSKTKNEIFAECDDILEKIKDRLDQLKNTFK